MSDPSSEAVYRLCRENSGKSLTSVGRISLYANALSVRYCGSPVYLVGGALTDPDPRDIDIAIVMPDALFIAAYANGDGLPRSGDPIGEWDLGGMSDDPPRIWRRWARDCAKQGADLTRRIGSPIVDFKTQPETWANRYELKPRRQLSIDILKPAFGLDLRIGSDDPSL